MNLKTAKFHILTATFWSLTGLMIFVVIILIIGWSATVQVQGTTTTILCDRDTDNTMRDIKKSYSRKGQVYLNDNSYLEDYCDLDIDPNSRVLQEYACDSDGSIKELGVYCGKSSNSCN